MGGPIIYKGEHIATYNLILLPNPRKPTENEAKFDLTFRRSEALKDLESLLKANSDEIIEVDHAKVPYKQFREEILKNLRRIYVDSLTASVDYFSKGLQNAGLAPVPK